MGRIKEKIFDIAEIIQDMFDEGVKDFEIDEYLLAQLTPEDYEFYHQHKDIIFNHFIEPLNTAEIEESILMPSIFDNINEGCGCGKKRPRPIIKKKHL
jgi:hypothetical protein